MKHRARKRGNDQGHACNPSGRDFPWSEGTLRFSVASGVVVSVTLVTGSVGDGILAVSAVAAAAHGLPRRGDPEPPMLA
jgi:hypothetical protein